MVFLQIAKELIRDTDKEVVSVVYWMDKFSELVIGFIPRLILALLLYILGTWLIRKALRILTKIFHRSHIDPSLRNFLIMLTRIILVILLLLTVISLLGINITSFAALLAGLGVALGSALNGALGNFAGGVTILVLKPFREGDLIEAQNHFGIVREIGIVYTSILTKENKTVRLPNGALSTGVVINYTANESLCINLKIPLDGKLDIDSARQLAVDVMLSHPDVLKDPIPEVKITDVGKEGISFVLCPKIKIGEYDPSNPRQVETDYYNVYYGVQEMVIKAFKSHQLS
ncbi:MAG TPA: mechanosensitive ion channel [Saprospiraceae bacterium]|jgi:small conductance mechanosensitive channel|nr:MAG: MscS Mechanosensitive ion channel [Candidatus Parvibacillus calidus]MCC7147928.1 mechanosensitive ion channel [Saprospiraceae bacterium]QLH30093.1 MAG: mechanosensitive ion channel [Candidatus Parvibacillus calidus]WKZ62650.1 MAG: mechanosensitive ion channel [Saprospiraceae bacterium]HPB53415.1 mechanosensitive ion channel [Saprospiraceae bacterium]